MTLCDFTVVVMCHTYAIGRDLIEGQGTVISLGCYKHEFLVSKETVVLRRWERSKQKFGFINSFDKTKFLL